MVVSPYFGSEQTPCFKWLQMYLLRSPVQGSPKIHLKGSHRCQVPSSRLGLARRWQGRGSVNEGLASGRPVDDLPPMNLVFVEGKTLLGVAKRTWSKGNQPLVGPFQVVCVCVRACLLRVPFWGARKDHQKEHPHVEALSPQNPGVLSLWWPLCRRELIPWSGAAFTIEGPRLRLRKPPRTAVKTATKHRFCGKFWQLPVPSCILKSDLDQVQDHGLCLHRGTCPM